MKKIIFTVIAYFIAAILSIHSVYADDFNGEDGETGNIWVGGGTDDYKWSQKIDSRGNYDYPDGLRVYIADTSTGRPTNDVIDLTNYAVGDYALNSNINGKKLTKYDYLNGSELNFKTDYTNKLIETSPDLLPRVIYSSTGSGRIETIKNWFLDELYADWVLEKLGTNINEMRRQNSSNESVYKLVFEPIFYFYFRGDFCAFTATEVALLDIMTGGEASNNLGATMIRQNLPLSVFLERDEFTGANKIPAWTGSISSPASNQDIKQYLGIGTVTYIGEPPAVIPGTTDFSYPTDTWVVTSFRLNNVRQSGGVWANGYPITSRNPASATITVNGTAYSISNIYIPSGNEQLVWVKWKTPSTPRNLTITATTDKGYWFNPNNSGSSNMYSNSIIASVNIYSNDMENPPPDPTLNDTQSSIGYNASTAQSQKNNITSTGTVSNSWVVWDCNFQLERTYTQTYSATNSYPSYPTGNTYDEPTGIYTERSIVNSYSNSYSVPSGTPGVNYYYTVYFVTVQFREYKYRYNRIIYTAEIRTSYININPDSHCPTDYVRNYKTYMKSGYGINTEVEPYIRVTVNYESTGQTTTDTYYSASSTGFAAAPQYVFAYFPEFCYNTYNRQLEYYNNKYVFKKNKYSTYNERTHYTPWWFPDNADYEILTRSDFAYTPAGRLNIYGTSSAIGIEGNLVDDWAIVPVR